MNSPNQVTDHEWPIFKTTAKILGLVGALGVVSLGTAEAIDSDNTRKFCENLAEGKPVKDELWSLISSRANKNNLSIKTPNELSELCAAQTNSYGSPEGPNEAALPTVTPKVGCITLSLKHVSQEALKRNEIATLIANTRKIKPAKPSGCHR